MRNTVLYLALLVFANVSMAQTPVTDKAEPLNVVAVASDLNYVWDNTEHSFGAIPQGEPVTHTFVITNTGKSPIALSGVRPGCGCTATDYSQDDIPPGGTGYVVATYNSAAAGPFTKSVTVQYVDGSTPTLLYLKGEVIQK